MIPACVAIGDLVDVRGGGTPSKANAEFWAGTIPWVSPKDMKRWEISDSEDKITEEAIKGSATNLIPPNSILVVNRSGILKHTLPVGITRRSVAINQDIKALVCRSNVCPEYLAYMVKAAEPIVLKWVRATTADNFSIDNLRSLAIPFPSLDEQRRIAAILDKADALRRKRKRALDLLDTLIQSIFVEMFGDGDRTSCQDRVRLGDLLVGIDSGWSPVCLDRPAEAPEPGILKLSCISRSGYLSGENKALPSELSPKNALEVRAGDILFARKNTRELVGSSVYIWETRPRLFFSDLIFRLRPDLQFLDPLFLQAQLSTERKRKGLSELAGGVAGSMPNISKGRLAEFEIFLAPTCSQAVFRAACEKSRVLIESATVSLFAADQIFASLQSRAFSGQL